VSQQRSISNGLRPINSREKLVAIRCAAVSPFIGLTSPMPVIPSEVRTSTKHFPPSSTYGSTAVIFSARFSWARARIEQYQGVNVTPAEIPAA
jgi:hypothetical protein